MKTPFDVAAFGPRAAWGLLLSAPDRLSALPSDLEKLSELVLRDDRPVEERSALVLKVRSARGRGSAAGGCRRFQKASLSLNNRTSPPLPSLDLRWPGTQEAEDVLVECLEKGATLEADLLSNIKAALPGDMAAALEELLPTPPNMASSASAASIVPVEMTEASGRLYDAQSVAAEQAGKMKNGVAAAYGGGGGSSIEDMAGSEAA